MGKSFYIFTADNGQILLNASLIQEIVGGQGNDVINTVLSTVGAAVLTAAALVGGQISRGGTQTGAFIDTTDTATNIVAALGADFTLGQTFTFLYKNGTSAQATLAAGSGVTNTAVVLIPPNSMAQYFGTVGGTQANPTITLAHQFTCPLHVAAEVSNPIETALNTVGAGTITAAGLNSGITLRGGTQVAVFTDTLDTLTDILAGVSAISNTPGATCKWRYVNNTVYTATIQGVTNVTISGQVVVPPNSWVEYLVTNVAGTSITLAPIASGYFPSKGTYVANGTTAVTVAAASVTASSIINSTLQTVGGTVGAVPAVKTVTPGTGFTVAGTASDTSTYEFEVRG